MAIRSERERELLDRWRSIENELDADDDPSPSTKRRLLSAKESWFSDSFDFLTKAPKETHIWCSYSDIMAPLLETFHSYFEESNSSPLKTLFKRISNELSSCTQCVCNYHQAQESYSLEYQYDSVGPLLETLQRLDEERVTEHLKDINERIRVKKYDANYENGEVVSLMFEVLMYPILLDDRSLCNEFQIFIEAIDDAYEVNLSDEQQYPGVYALLFFTGGRARAIGLRLARCMGKLKEASDLEQLQPLLKKWIGFLENEVLPSSIESPRPRVQLKRSDVWLGIKSILGFLEGPAFEDGILEKYPVFLNIILNHVSDDTSDFSYAVSCLKASFEMLGCKLWLRATLSPSVMRNTLLGHCFHTKDEKSHKDIFDLFIPFLQSLESLQDGEHEKQRRNIIYFLLHQVTRSSNFSHLMHKNACKIAILIVYRGYTMDPPSPPYECAHMWGPSLINSLKDITLHISLRQPAFDLINSILISDSCALISKHLSLSKNPQFNDSEEEEQLIPFSNNNNNNNNNNDNSNKPCWDEFKSQWNLTLRGCDNWRCIPLLWHTAFLQMDPLVLPISFSKAVFWTLSKISITCFGFNSDMGKSADEWMNSHMGDLLGCFKWETPSGSNDGGEGKECKNSVQVAESNWLILMRAFKRFSVHFVVQIERRELQKQWNWEPEMTECLILLLIDPNDSIRQADRAILEHVSKDRILTVGLQFLCSSESSLSSMFLGLKYVFKLVQLDPIEANFQNMHHIFFIMKKLLKEVINPSQSPLGKPIGASPLTKSLTGNDGGFLKQPGSNNPLNSSKTAIVVDIITWEKFSSFLAAVMWPFVLKCLEKGDKIMELKQCEMTSVRLFEMLPFVLDRLGAGLSNKTLENSAKYYPNIHELNWLYHLANWGKSSLIVVFRHWKHCIISVFQFLKEFKFLGNMDNNNNIQVLEAIVSADPINMELLLDSISNLRSSSSKEPPKKSTEKISFLKTFFNYQNSNEFFEPSGGKNVIILSEDEEEERETTEKEIKLPSPSFEKPKNLSKKEKLNESVRKEALKNEKLKEKKQIKPSIVANEPSKKSLIKPSEKTIAQDKPILNQDKSYEITNEPFKKPLIKPSEKQIIQDKPVLNQNKSNEKDKSLINQIIQDDKIPDPLDIALDKTLDKPVMRAPLPLTKSLALPTKRQVVQLPMPNGNKNNYNNSFRNRNTSLKRLQKAKLDDWFKHILQMDYFSIINSSETEKNDNNNSNFTNLKRVPLNFESPNHYIEIFKPLVLEELKAQLKSSFLEGSNEELGKIKVVLTERIDEFLQVSACMDEKVIMGSRGGCAENDLVLITSQPFKSNPTPQSNNFFGYVKSKEKDKNHRTTLIIRFLIPNIIRSKIRERSEWYLNRVLNIIPQTREFQALSSLHYIPILPTILNPIINNNNNRNNNSNNNRVQLDQLKMPLRKMLSESFNESQLEAISVAIGKHKDGKDFELSLIQGPPGTGKTRTIVAIVSALLASPLVQKNYSSYSNPNNSKSDWSTRSNPKNLSQTSSVVKAWQDLDLAKQLMKDTKSQQDPSFSEITERPLKGRVLICAQSNAAVDELVSRLSEGLFGNDGNFYKPFIVRVGNQKTIHANSLPLFIDTLVEQKISEDLKMKEINETDFESSTSLRAKWEKVVDNIRYYESRRAKLNPNESEIEQDLTRNNSIDIPDDQIGAKLNVLYSQKRKINTELNKAHERERKMAEENRFMKSKLRNQILRDAQIVLTTLSGAGGDLYDVCSDSTNGKFGNISEHSLFDVVVIDEAAQALEPATLIPLLLLKSKGTKCVMVGDPKQLPATVMSGVASKYLYECSMFERLQKAGHPVIMLTEQYRMHPEISRFPSLHFYENKLLNGAHMSEKSAIFHEMKYLGPYMFFDIMDGQERQSRSSGSQSLSNDYEIEVATDMLKFLKKRYESEFNCKKIGIITPYRSQLHQLKSKFTSAFGPESVSEMELNTVDGFQGREVDILILSTVRASFNNNSERSGPTGGGIGFVADVRRMNVALTRAKLSLWILGNAKTLSVNPHWYDLIKDAKKRDLFVSIRRPYSSIFTNETPDLKRKYSDNFSDNSNNTYSNLRRIESSGTREKHGVRETQNPSKSIQNPNSSTQKHRASQNLNSSTQNPRSSQGPNTSTQNPRPTQNPNSSTQNLRPTQNPNSSTQNPRPTQNPNLKAPQGDINMRNLVDRANDIQKSTPNPNRSSQNPKATQNPCPSIGRSSKQVQNDSSSKSKFTEKTKSSNLGQVGSSNLEHENRNNKKMEFENRNKRRLENDNRNKEKVESENRNKGKIQNENRNTNSGENMLNSARKRQREAVESLLSSALISTKKPKKP